MCAPGLCLCFSWKEGDIKLDRKSWGGGLKEGEALVVTAGTRGGSSLYHIERE